MHQLAVSCGDALQQVAAHRPLDRLTVPRLIQKADRAVRVNQEDHIGSVLHQRPPLFLAGVQRVGHAVRFVHVAERAGHPRQIARGVPNRLPTSRVPAIFPLLCPQAVFDVVRNSPLNVIAYGLHDALPIIGVQMLKKRAQTIGKLVFGETKQLLESARPPDGRVGRVPNSVDRMAVP